MAISAPPVIDGVVFDPVPARHHGGDYVAPGRYTVTGDWMYPRPEVCLDDRPDGVWIAGGQILICPSCGPRRNLTNIARRSS